jgi:hypothetical protein
VLDYVQYQEHSRPLTQHTNRPFVSTQDAEETEEGDGFTKVIVKKVYRSSLMMRALESSAAPGNGSKR